MAKQLRKSKEKKICGVCAGLADYFDIDATVMRLIAIILLLASFGTGLLIYLIAALVMPETDKKDETKKEQLND